MRISNCRLLILDEERTDLTMNKRAIIVLLAMLFFVPCLAVAGFTDNGNGTVTDAITNLVWQQCAMGYTTTATNCDTASGATADSWENAISYCEGLSLGGSTDWRLPHIKELRSIVDSKRLPVINITYFPAPFSYWSSTTYASITGSAWFMNFAVGNVGGVSKLSSNAVRCVR
jgi:hypothetical protein